MSNALFLPRELFSSRAPAKPTMQPERPRQSAQFASGDAVAADLLRGLAPATLPGSSAPTERRRQPRAARPIG